MTKALRCHDAGFDCVGVIRAETEDEVLRQAAEHARVVHDMETISPEVEQRIRAAIHDE